MVAGLGVAAGGEECCGSFLAALSGESGIAYVLTVGGDPSGDAAGRLAALESRCALPWLAIEPGAALSADAIHVVPPGSRISFERGRIELSQGVPSADPIGESFATIVSTFGARAACVAFGGAGDGSGASAALRLACDEGGAAFVASAGGDVASSGASGTRFIAPERLPEALRAHARGLRAPESVASPSPRPRAGALEILGDLSSKLVGALDPDTVMQAVADAGRALTGAEFGAFYCIVEGDTGSGRARCRFSGDDEATELEPALGVGDARWDDVSQEALSDSSGKVFGLSKGARPIRSYLGSLVRGRDGRAIGSLRYGHSEAEAFGADSEAALRALAAHAAVAMENARLAAALRENEERARRVLCSGHDALFVYPILDDGRPGKLIDVNQQATDALGYSRDELLQMTIYDFVVAPDGETEATFQRFRDKGGAMLHMSHRRKDGSLLPVEVSATLVQLDGRPHVISKARDIADRLRAQEAASLLAAVGGATASAMLYDESLSDLARAVVPGFADWCAVDRLQPDGSLRRVATTHADPKSQALARRFFDEVDPDFGDFLGVREALRSLETQWRAEVGSSHDSAAARHEEQARLLETLGLRSCICVPLAARGEVFGAISFVAGESRRRYDEQDVALARDLGRHASQAIDNARLYRRQIEALQEAKETQALLDTVIANAPVGMALLDRDLRFVQVNKILAAMNELDGRHGAGASLREALPDLWPSLRPDCERMLRGEVEVARLELRRGADERPEDARFFDYTLYAVRSASSEVVGVGIIAQEVTDNKRFEASLAFAREQAEAANRSKSEFLANMSHEIRTPMTSIIGYASILGQQLEDPEQIECVNTIRRNGEFLTEIINDILDLSRIEAGRLQIALKRCNPSELISEAMSLMRVRAQEKQLALESSFDGLLPETIETDPVRLRQILVNLMGNAIKFTEKGSVRLETRLIVEEGRLECRIVDTGIGMSEDQLGRIFQPFEQADTSVSRRFGGSGLGLTICKRLVQMLGGEIGATSALGAGSVFTFCVRTGALEGVPLVDPAARIVPARREVARRAVSLDCRALVVDDRQEIRQLAKRYVEDAGGQVRVASDGARCLEEVQRAAAEGRPFDVVVLDVQMPVMDGFEAVRRLRGLGFDKPVIALTAHAMKGDREKLLRAGCDDCATKPIDQAKFIELIARHIQPRGAGAEGADASEVEPPVPSAEAKATAGGQRKGKRLLIVEDDFSLRRILSIAFEQRGHETQVASTGEDAIEIARAFKPDVALVDLGLPDMTGHDLAQLLRELPELRETKLFALSGRDRPEDIRRSEQVGFRRHIVKPPDIEEVEKYFYE